MSRFPRREPKETQNGQRHLSEALRGVRKVTAIVPEETWLLAVEVIRHRGGLPEMRGSVGALVSEAITLVHERTFGREGRLQHDAERDAILSVATGDPTASKRRLPPRSPPRLGT